MDSPQKLLSDCRSGQRDSLAEYYNRLVHDYPELATAVPSCACTRNVLANRLAAGDLRWLRAEHIDEWEPASIGWLVGWATSRASLEALIPLVQQAGSKFPGSRAQGFRVPRGPLRGGSPRPSSRFSKGRILAFPTREFRLRDES